MTQPEFWEMKSEQALTTRVCTAMTKAGTAISNEIASTAAIDRTLSIFADQLTAPFRCRQTPNLGKTRRIGYA
jgi:hypothetical protein